MNDVADMDRHGQCSRNNLNYNELQQRISRKERKLLLFVPSSFPSDELAVS